MVSTFSSKLDETERLAWLSLKLLPDLGNRSLLRLIKHFGSPSAILGAAPAAVAAVPDIKPHAVKSLTQKRFIRHPEAEMEILKKQGVELLCLGDPTYPENLKAIADPPVAMFVKGSLEPRDLVSIAVVGSRAASPMGLVFTEELCQELARSGVTVVSGLAVGIDSAAHRGALKAGGRTLAVLGCGLDVNYPKGAGSLRRKIVENGAIVSEFPLGTLPAAGHFPQRNRIISGLSLGVVVVEAAHRSGSLITARLALDQGREVFAVPGMAGQYRSAGVNRLLREGARLVERAEDILEEIRPVIRSSGSKILEEGKKKEDSGSDLSPEEQELLLQVDRMPRHIDEICRGLQWPMSRVLSMLLALELKGRVRELPGKYFVVKG